MSYLAALQGVSGLGGAGQVGAGGGQYSSSAESRGSGDRTLGGDLSDSSAGNRGFINNVAFPGATQSIDQGINPPVSAAQALGRPLIWIGAAAVGVALLIWAKAKKVF